MRTLLLSGAAAMIIIIGCLSVAFNTGYTAVGSGMELQAPQIEKKAVEEDLQASLAALASPEQYEMTMQRHDAAGFAMFPIPVSAEKRATTGVIANAHVIKAAEDFSDLGESASAILFPEVKDSLAAYLHLYQERFDKIANRVKVDLPPGVPVGYSMQVSSNKDESPTLAGLKGKLLALMACTTMLNVDCHAVVCDVVTEARKQYAASRTLDETNIDPQAPSRGFLNIIQASLYNRQLLSTAMLACEKDMNKRIELMTRIGLTCEDEHFGGRISMEIPYCEEVTDEQFEQLAVAIFPEFMAK